MLHLVGAEGGTVNPHILNVVTPSGSLGCLGGFAPEN